VTIETTYDNVEVVKGADYTYPLPFEMSLNASKTELTVTVPENTTGESRRAAIIVSATTQEGKKISEALYLYQSAEEASPYYITFDKTNVEVGKDADTYEFTSECNFYWYKAEYSHTFEVNGDDRHRWFEFKNGEYEVVDGKCIDKWYLTVEKNDWGFDRKAVIDLLVYDKDSTMTAKTQITIVQKSGETLDYVVKRISFKLNSTLSGPKITDDNGWPEYDAGDATLDLCNYQKEYSKNSFTSFVTTRSGNGIHVEVTCSKELRNSAGDEILQLTEAKISFDITNIFNNVKNVSPSKIMNFKYYENTSDFSYNKKYVINETASGLDFNENNKDVGARKDWGAGVYEYESPSCVTGATLEYTGLKSGKTGTYEASDMKGGWISIVTEKAASTSRTRSSEMQTTTTTERITRHVER
jgi:hypothetical protein